MKNNVIYLSVNTEVLNNMIGKDTEAQIDIRKGIVENFAKKNLKSLLNDENMKVRLDNVEAKVLKSVEEQVRISLKKHVISKGNWGNRNITLSSDIREKIRQELKTAFSDLITEENKILRSFIKKELSNQKDQYEKLIADEVKKLVNKDFEQRVQNEIKRRFDAVKA